jgi:hypothetical protein
VLGLLAAYVVVAGPAGPAGGYNRADDRQCALVTSHICILTKKCQNELFFYHLVEKLLSSKIIIIKIKTSELSLNSLGIVGDFWDIFRNSAGMVVGSMISKKGDTYN